MALQEGRTRRFWVLETSTRWLAESGRPSSAPEFRAYARGYFDAEGGIPQALDARFYIQFVQNDRADIDELRRMLEALGIVCGRLHNPSAAKDPDLWRFYVAAASHATFIEEVGSWHPRKRGLLELRASRMKI